MLHGIPASNNLHEALFPNKALRIEIVSLHFKCEDFRFDGCEIGPLYAVLQDRSELRSAKYVTLAQARQLASGFGVALTES